MVKVYCDICGKEIIRANEVWKLSLAAKPGNPRVSYDETAAEMCEMCATLIHSSLALMKNGLKPNFADSSPEKVATNG